MINGHRRSIEKMVYEKILYAIFCAKVIKPYHVVPTCDFTVNQSACSKKVLNKKLGLPVYYQHPTKIMVYRVIFNMSYII